MGSGAGEEKVWNGRRKRSRDVGIGRERRILLRG